MQGQIMKRRNKNISFMSIIMALTMILKRMLVLHKMVSTDKLEDGIFTYTIKNNEAIITGVIDKSIEVIIIPSKVGKNNFNVRGIGDFSFSNCKNLKTINISEGIRDIGQYAFANCSNLTNIKIPKGVRNIDEYAFNSCKKIINIDIPKGVKSIRQGTFFGCSELESIVIPESIISIEKFTFFCCTNLKNISIPKEITSIENNAFSNIADTGCVQLIGKTEVGQNDIDRIRKKLSKDIKFEEKKWNIQSKKL